MNDTPDIDGSKLDRYDFISYRLQLFDRKETAQVDDLLDFLYKRTYAERKTFIWIVNPFDLWHLRALKDADGNCPIRVENNMNMLYDRPVFYSNDVEKNWIVFRSYI